jgi:hypothetical protein
MALDLRTPRQTSAAPVITPFDFIFSALADDIRVDAHFHRSTARSGGSDVEVATIDHR